MRVRMTYSLEMDDIPIEVAGLLQKRVKELHDAMDLIEDAVQRLSGDKPNVKMDASAIDLARQKMASFDLTLADVHGILTGFVDAEEQLANPPADSNPPTSPEPLGDLDV